MKLPTLQSVTAIAAMAAARRWSVTGPVLLQNTINVTAAVYAAAAFGNRTKCPVSFFICIYLPVVVKCNKGIFIVAVYIPVSVCAELERRFYGFHCCFLAANDG